jgi:type I restriction enzyme R subunit
MTERQRVAGGDRIGKTIIFAKNQAHAEFIAQRFDVNYPKFKGAFARAFRHGWRISPVRKRLVQPREDLGVAA